MLTTLNQQSTKTDLTESKLIKSNQDRGQNNGHQEEQSDQSSRSQPLLSDKNGVVEVSRQYNHIISHSQNNITQYGIVFNNTIICFCYYLFY